MRAVHMTLVILFIVLTLGAISISISWNDGVEFEYHGWVERLRK